MHTFSLLLLIRVFILLSLRYHFSYTEPVINLFEFSVCSLVSFMCFTACYRSVYPSEHFNFKHCSQTEQVSADEPDEEVCPCLPGWRWKRRANSSSPVKEVIFFRERRTALVLKIVIFHFLDGVVSECSLPKRLHRLFQSPSIFKARSSGLCSTPRHNNNKNTGVPGPQSAEKIKQGLRLMLATTYVACPTLAPTLCER